MNLRKRIITSMIILLILPMAMTVIGFLCFVAYQSGMIEKQYGDTSAFEAIANPIKTLDYLTTDVYEELKKCSEEEPEKLLDKDYLDEITTNIDSEYAFVAVREGEEYIYAANESWLLNIKDEIPAYDGETDGNKLVYLACQYPCLLKQLDFMVDGKQCSVFIIIFITNIVPQIKYMVVQIVFHMVIITICTAIVLIIWLYASMLKPLNGLSNAAKRITEGDLDFEIKDETDDEIGTLCADFEKMRQRLKAYMDKQEQNDRETREMISNISHDLKTPLTAIKGYSEGILDGVADTDEKREKYIRTIYNKANAMTALVDELSLFAKIDNESAVYNFSSIRVKDYFDDYVEEIKTDMELMGINVGYFNEIEDGVKIYADAEQLKKVISNITVNSMKYIDKSPGIINIFLKDIDEKYIEVSIEDNGCGIAKADLDKIFDRFYRTDASRNSKQGGTGLGLSIAKKIVNAHGGRIMANSEEGVGTAIIFTLKKIDNLKV